MPNIHILNIARIFCLVAPVAIAASVASAQQPPNKYGASLTTPLFSSSASSFTSTPSFASSTTSPAFSTASPVPPFQNQMQDAKPAPTYVRPNFHQRLRFYAFHTYGPVTMAQLAIGSAVSQADNVPPEWHQGWGAYGKRFASDVGTSTVGGTTEFALAEVFRVDTIYYPCTCKGVWRRVRHAVISTVTARAGEDGHRVFSVPAIANPYAGAFSTLIWYPSRYGPKDSFRTGNYDLLDRVGQSIALEFLLPVLHKFHLP